MKTQLNYYLDDKLVLTWNSPTANSTIPRVGEWVMVGTLKCYVRAIVWVSPSEMSYMMHRTEHAVQPAP